TPETTQVSGAKTWNDNNDQDGKRPKSITVNLLANGEVVQSQKVSADTNWTYTFTNLPKYANGKEIVYTVSEEKVDGYEMKVEGTNITNTHTPETTEVAGAKTWNDNNDQDGKRPKSITVNLLADGKVIKSQQVTAENDWKY
ncbi:Cna B-type domain-containing protein, partial [Streptococcus ruminantium]